MYSLFYYKAIVVFLRDLALKEINKRMRNFELCKHPFFPIHQSRYGQYALTTHA